MGMPGIPELLIIGLILVVVVAVLMAIVFSIVILSRRRPGGNHNLKPCPDCGRLLSLRATACPHCGCPLQKQETWDEP